jgi:hypothetical protein
MTGGADAATSEDSTQNPVEVLRRWEQFGGVWRVVSFGEGRAVVSLCRCDDGEEVRRIESDEPALFRLLADRDTFREGPD